MPLIFIMIGLSVTLKSSRILLLATVAMSMVTSFSVGLFFYNASNDIAIHHLALIFSFTFLAVLISVSIFQWRKCSPIRLDIANDGTMLLRQRRKGDNVDRTNKISLHHDSVIWHGIMVLHFSGNGDFRHSLVVMCDSTDKISFQRLRVSLLWMRQHCLAEVSKKNEFNGNLN